MNHLDNSIESVKNLTNVMKSIEEKTERLVENFRSKITKLENENDVMWQVIRGRLEVCLNCIELSDTDSRNPHHCEICEKSGCYKCNTWYICMKCLYTIHLDCFPEDKLDLLDVDMCPECDHIETIY